MLPRARLFFTWVQRKRRLRMGSIPVLSGFSVNHSVFGCHLHDVREEWEYHTAVCMAVVETVGTSRHPVHNLQPIGR